MRYFVANRVRDFTSLKQMIEKTTKTSHSTYNMCKDPISGGREDYEKGDHEEE